ncbi:unnamed protein product [Allacma fusca]|uniref:Uncharacterized protein n=1 Tax=Allacma fusca TaxID=39272 RepID=A0A8J2JZR2_9HEXA|nr:unnamed protein product [Allacma fusca]
MTYVCRNKPIYANSHHALFDDNEIRLKDVDDFQPKEPMPAMHVHPWLVHYFENRLVTLTRNSRLNNMTCGDYDNGQGHIFDLINDGIG